MIKKFLPLIATLGLLSNIASADTQAILDSKPEQYLKQVLDQLNLSAEQKTELSTYMHSVEPLFVQNMAKSNANNRALNELTGENYDELQVDKLAYAEGFVVADTIKLRMQVRHEIYEILTPEQRLKVKKLNRQI
jgi:Spy/CpxP family protein refolding chaperone